MVSHDARSLLRSIGIDELAVGFGIKHFMNQHSGPLRKPYQVLRITSVAGKHDRMPSIVNPVSKRRFEQAMIYFEGSYFKVSVLINNAFLNVLRLDLQSLRRQVLIDITPHVNIEGIGLPEVRHHTSSSRRSPHAKRNFASHHPTGEPEVWNPHDVIGVQMSKEQAVNLFDLDLVKPLQSTTAAIEQQFLLPRLDQNARAKALHRRTWVTGAEQGHLKGLRGRRLRRGRLRKRGGQSEPQRQLQSEIPEGSGRSIHELGIKRATAGSGPGPPSLRSRHPRTAMCRIALLHRGSAFRDGCTLFRGRCGFAWKPCARRDGAASAKQIATK